MAPHEQGNDGHSCHQGGRGPQPSQLPSRQDSRETVRVWPTVPMQRCEQQREGASRWEQWVRYAACVWTHVFTAALVYWAVGETTFIGEGPTRGTGERLLPAYMFRQRDVVWERVPPSCKRASINGSRKQVTDLRASAIGESRVSQ